MVGEKVMLREDGGIRHLSGIADDADGNTVMVLLMGSSSSLHWYGGVRTLPRTGVRYNEESKGGNDLPCIFFISCLEGVCL